MGADPETVIAESSSSRPIARPSSARDHVAPDPPAESGVRLADARHPAQNFAELQHQLAQYLGESDLKRVREAYRFADAAHLGQFRRSGEPYITHPIAVGSICAGWRLDAPAIMAALMHDTMEDKGIPKSEIVEKFGSAVAELVDGLSKLDKVKFQSVQEGQAESFRKMLLAMSRDVRVILVKLADRLHNMRTLEAMAAAKRRRIARETLDIYAQIAYRLGLNSTFRELQDLSFRHLYPYRYAVLGMALRNGRKQRRELEQKTRQSINQAFARAGMAIEISSREKSLYSIYRKMRQKHLDFAKVLDVQGFRIVVDERLDCYRALGIVHQLFPPISGTFKDYIAIPKSNGYQSLHTTVQGIHGHAVEFQIRTQSMDHMAESGIAAHWLYKATTGTVQTNAAERAQSAATAMLQTLLEVAGESRDPNEFFELVKVGLESDSIYVMTPRGEVVGLPRGATPVDFAYAIHSEVGHRCVGALVNDELTPLRAHLANGDRVSIQTSEAAQPNPEWLSFVRTARAKQAIRHFLRNADQQGAMQLGQRLLIEALSTAQAKLDQFDDSDWLAMLALTDERSREALWLDIGMGRRSAQAVARSLIAARAQRTGERDAEALGPLRFVLDGSEGSGVRYARCCFPIPGDVLLASLGRGQGMEVHSAGCPLAQRGFQRHPQQWVEVSWGDNLQRGFEVLIGVRVENGKGVLGRISTAIAQADANILHVRMEESRGEAAIDLEFTLEVRDREHLDEVLRRLMSTPLVIQAERKLAPGVVTD